MRRLSSKKELDAITERGVARVCISELPKKDNASEEQRPIVAR